MGKRRVLAWVISLSIIGTLVGCNKSNKEPQGEVTVATIKEKYASKEKESYKDPMYNLERSHNFKFEMDAGLKDKVKLNDIFKVYTNSELTQKVSAKIDYSDSDGKVTIAPPNFPVWASLEEAKEFGIEELTEENIDTYTNPKWNTDWGNANNYYLVQYYDLKSGEKLLTPVVTVFTIKPDIETPTVKFEVSKEGKATLKWDKVEGADKYIVYSIDENNIVDGVYPSVEGETEETSFDGFRFAQNDYDGKVISMNTTFDTADTKKKTFCVMAVADNKKSLMSNVIAPKEYANKVPCFMAIKSDDEFFMPVEGVNSLPTHLPIKMASGDDIKYPISYDIESKEIVTYTVDDSKAVKIKAKVEGTAFEWDCYAIHIDESNLEKDLKELQDRQKGIVGKSLKNDTEVNVPNTPPKDVKNNEEDSKETSSENTKKVPKSDNKVFATTAMGEYIALNMLEGNEKISLKEFPEASNKEKLADTIMEVKYQNPLVMTVKSAMYDYKTNELTIKYGQDKSTLKKQQNEVNTEVDKVIKDIIKDGMTDLEKETAINEYICKSAEYDYKALENAEKNNMKTVDESFNDSFTPYGVLVKKVGVCASYASAYKLLADEAKLDSIVVIGNLNGTLPHAWNRTLIDGNWMTIDTTNNDKDDVPNALFNIPDNESKKILVENSEYIDDSIYGTYKGESEELEYYRVNKKYFSRDTIVDEAVSQLKANKKVTIRTDYNITDVEFNKIGQEILTKLGVEKVKGKCFLGVLDFEIP